MISYKKYLLLAWFSFILTMLFFYPLIATLDDNYISLQWRIKNTLELLCVIAIISITLTLFLWMIEYYCHYYLSLFLYLIISVIPLLFFFIHMMRQLGYKDFLIRFSEVANNHNKIAILFTFIFILICVLKALSLYIFKYPSRMINIGMIFIIIFFPINILEAWTIYKQRIDTITDIKKDPESLKKDKIPDHNIIFFLFDEMSYDYLYNNGKINSNYSNFLYLSSISDNYHSAVSPGDKTLTSLPGLIYGVKFENLIMEYNNLYKITENNKKEILNLKTKTIFAKAKEKGFKTLMFGPYLPYCKLLGSDLDECHSFSIYNYGTLEKNFSLINPILTTFFILPRQYPSAIVKNISASNLQKQTIAETYRLTIEAFDNKIPFFLFVHFYIPHLPFVFNKNGYYDNRFPFLQNHENYSKQMDYVDTVLGKLISELKLKGQFKNSIIVVLADHNFRSMFPNRKTSIPLIIKKVNQLTHNDIYEKVEAAEVLHDLFNE